MRFLLHLTLLAGFTHTTLAADFVGREQCVSCHQEQHQLWQGSHHDLAMQVPNAETVLGDFNNATFEYNGITTRFFQRDGKYIVHTDGPTGELQDFEVAYVFGVDPLQQYLLPIDGGRLQTLSIAWDARPASEGGQRWYHLYPDELIDANDPLHWTGPYQNWNTRCAECHSTDVHKNYNAESRSFDTRFAEIDVSCEACHGPGSKHVELASSGKLNSAIHAGFALDLGQRGLWAFAEGAAIAHREQALEGRMQVDACGRCHSRRGELGEYVHGKPLTDTHRVSLPLTPLYHHDGQILDEVYVYGSFMQSKMQSAGVVCSNCHEPHSLKLRAPGNGVCAQCHRPNVYDTAAHHHHPADSDGAQCVECHMPETTYMGVDPRRDHSLRVPRPDLSVVLGTPNACTQCHTDKDDSWALQQTRDWGVQYRDTATHPARAFAAAANGDSRAAPALTSLVNAEEQPPIWRAAALEALSPIAAREAYQSAVMLIASNDPLLRAAAVTAVRPLPPARRYVSLRTLIDDPDTSVRLAVASALASVPLDQLPADKAEQLLKLFKEYETVYGRHRDMPGVQMQLGVFHTERGDLPAAEKDYHEALRLNPQLVAAYLNLADLLRSTGREAEARQQLMEALAVAPENGNTLYALGLLEIREGNGKAALDYLKRAAELEQQGTRHRYVYAVALHDNGDVDAALRQLHRALRSAPYDQELLVALANYSAQAGQRERALDYAQRLLQLAPDNPGYQQLVQQLRRP